jgi:hypothetical protein
MPQTSNKPNALTAAVLRETDKLVKPVHVVKDFDDLLRQLKREAIESPSQSLGTGPAKNPFSDKE